MLIRYIKKTNRCVLSYVTKEFLKLWDYCTILHLYVDGDIKPNEWNGCKHVILYELYIQTKLLTLT